MKHFILIVLVCSWLGAPVFADGGWSDIKDLPEDISGLVRAEQYDEAIGRLKDFVRDENKNADAWNLLGFSQRKVGQLEESLQSYKKALRLDSRHIGANEYIGELYLTLDKPKKARKHLKRLKKYCGDCEEMRDLEAAIKTYENNS